MTRYIFLLNFSVIFLHAAECRDPLGMQSGEIPDSAITASSSYDYSMVGPQHARFVDV